MSSREMLSSRRGTIIKRRSIQRVCCGLVSLGGLLVAVFVSGCLLTPAVETKLGDTTISGEVAWSGTVRINGIVTVKKEGQLIIAPGTEVIFDRFDRDGDGIGDGELLVEGTLLARGTAGQPIRFTSGEENPQPADWKYLYLDFAKRAEVAYVISEYAYSGIQVHFCKAVVANSVFRHNVDGVRFSTVNIKVRGNRIYDNRHGLRYEERRSEAVVVGNDIRNNDIGIFVVTRSEDKAKISGNNIVDSRQYAVKMGLTQKEDVTFPGNWWGTTNPAAIEELMFDQKQDETLGRVQTPDSLPGPMEIETELRE